MAPNRRRKAPGPVVPDVMDPTKLHDDFQKAAAQLAFNMSTNQFGSDEQKMTEHAYSALQQALQGLQSGASAQAVLDQFGQAMNPQRPELTNQISASYQRPQENANTFPSTETELPAEPVAPVSRMPFQLDPFASMPGKSENLMQLAEEPVPQTPPPEDQEVAPEDRGDTQLDQNTDPTKSGQGAEEIDTSAAELEAVTPYFDKARSYLTQQLDTERAYIQSGLKDTDITPAQKLLYETRLSQIDAKKSELAKPYEPDLNVPAQEAYKNMMLSMAEFAKEDWAHYNFSDKTWESLPQDSKQIFETIKNDAALVDANKGTDFHTRVENSLNRFALIHSIWAPTPQLGNGPRNQMMYTVLRDDQKGHYDFSQLPMITRRGDPNGGDIQDDYDFVLFALRRHPEWTQGTHRSPAGINYSWIEGRETLKKFDEWPDYVKKEYYEFAAKKYPDNPLYKIADLVHNTPFDQWTAEDKQAFAKFQDAYIVEEDKNFYLVDKNSPQWNKQDNDIFNRQVAHTGSSYYDDPPWVHALTALQWVISAGMLAVALPGAIASIGGMWAKATNDAAMAAFASLEASAAAGASSGSIAALTTTEIALQLGQNILMGVWAGLNTAMTTIMNLPRAVLSAMNQLGTAIANVGSVSAAEGGATLAEAIGHLAPAQQSAIQESLATLMGQLPDLSDELVGTLSRFSELGTAAQTAVETNLKIVANFASDLLTKGRLDNIINEIGAAQTAVQLEQTATTAVLANSMTPGSSQFTTFLADLTAKRALLDGITVEAGQLVPAATFQAGDKFKVLAEVGNLLQNTNHAKQVEYAVHMSWNLFQQQGRLMALGIPAETISEFLGTNALYMLKDVSNIQGLTNLTDVAMEGMQTQAAEWGQRALGFGATPARAQLMQMGNYASKFPPAAMQSLDNLLSFVPNQNLKMAGQALADFTVHGAAPAKVASSMASVVGESALDAVPGFYSALASGSKSSVLQSLSVYLDGVVSFYQQAGQAVWADPMTYARRVADVTADVGKYLWREHGWIAKDAWETMKNQVKSIIVGTLFTSLTGMAIKHSVAGHSYVDAPYTDEVEKWQAGAPPLPEPKRPPPPEFEDDEDDDEYYYVRRKKKRPRLERADQDSYYY